MKIVYFASLREDLNLNKEILQINQPITVLKLRQLLIEKYGEYLFKKTLLCAINQEIVTDEQLINNRDEVAFFPTITGG